MNLLECVKFYQDMAKTHGKAYAGTYLIKNCGVSKTLVKEIAHCFGERGEPIDSLGERVIFTFAHNEAPGH